jgi:hypothetical protein
MALLFKKYKLYTDYKSQTIDLSKVTTTFVKASWLEQFFLYRWGYHPRRSNVAYLLSLNPLDEKWVMLALLIRSNSSYSFQRMATNTGRSASMEMTNTRKNPLGFNNELFNKIIAGYALDLWFKDPFI